MKTMVHNVQSCRWQAALMKLIVSDVHDGMNADRIQECKSAVAAL